MEKYLESLRNFENSIRYDAHSTLIAYGRSQEKEELLQIVTIATSEEKKKLLESIAMHLKGMDSREYHYPAVKDSVKVGLGLLCGEIHEKLGSCLCQKPEKVGDISGWIKWAEDTVKTLS